jgi:hypothetical protein
MFGNALSREQTCLSFVTTASVHFHPTTPFHVLMIGIMPCSCVREKNRHEGGAQRPGVEILPKNAVLAKSSKTDLNFAIFCFNDAWIFFACILARLAAFERGKRFPSLLEPADTLLDVKLYTIIFPATTKYLVDQNTIFNIIN